jgi:ribosomal protein S18 acetylase RimI-like enzyme
MRRDAARGTRRRRPAKIARRSIVPGRASPYPVGMVRIVPLDESTFDDFAVMARRTAPLPMCWCQHWRMRSRDFAKAKVPELRQRLRDQAAGPIAPGLVAIEDEADAPRVVGWVGLGPRTDFERIVRSRVIPTIDERPAWAITCFAVPAAARGRGIARALLEAAIAYAAANGAERIEAYPVVVDEDGGTARPDAVFTGTLPMFQRAGFRVVADRASDPSATNRRVVVRRELV